MGLKSIEMQVAIPRSQDAGQMQEQLSKQGQKFQETLTQQQLNEELIKRTKVNEYDDVEKKIVDDEEERQQEQREKEQKKQQKKSNQKDVQHPYLGSRIDYSG